MKGLPRIARARLSGKGPVSREVPVSPAASVHPDANLLSAFTERSLTPAERTRVFEHLAVCAECRAEVQLALRASGVANGAAIAPAAVRAPAPGSRWQSVLRWDAVAAACAAIGAVLMFQIAIRSGARFAVPPPAPASIARNTSTGSPGPALEARNVPTPPMKQLETQARALRERETPATGANRPADALKKTPAGVMAGAIHAQVAEPAVPPAGSTPLPSPPAPLAQASDAPTPVTAPRALAAAPTSVAESKGAPTASAAPQISRRQAANSSAALTPKLALGEAKVAGRAPAPASSPGTVGGLTAGVAGFMSASQPLTRWRIPPAPSIDEGDAKGFVERSLDGGRTWQPLAIDPDVRFRAVAVTANQVWAGGSGAALYRSGDGGQHWVRVKLATQGIEAAGDIVAIRFSDPEHGRIETSGGGTWITTDGGTHWEKLP